MKNKTSRAAKFDAVRFDSPHTDASGSSRPVLVAMVCIGKSIRKLVKHLTPGEEIEFNR